MQYHNNVKTYEVCAELADNKIETWRVEDNDSKIRNNN